LKTGALTDRFVAAFFLTAPSAEKFRSARDAGFLFFISARINSRAALLADAVILRSPLGRRFLSSRRALFRTVWRFTCTAVFLSLKIDQCDHRATDFVIGGTIGAQAQRLLVAFLIGRFAIAGA